MKEIHKLVRISCDSCTATLKGLDGGDLFDSKLNLDNLITRRKWSKEKVKEGTTKKVGTILYFCPPCAHKRLGKIRSK